MIHGATNGTKALHSLCRGSDTYTQIHLAQVQNYAQRILQELKKSSQYAALLSPSFLQAFGAASALHDIGKRQIAREILLKPGKLTAEEYEIMKGHTTLGAKAVQALEAKMGASAFTEMAFDIVCYHHERFDGTGYPAGLSAEKIPLAAQIISVADVFDALCSQRTYKEAFTPEKAFSIILEGKGTQFAPAVVEAFARSIGKK